MVTKGVKLLCGAPLAMLVAVALAGTACAQGAAAPAPAATASAPVVDDEYTLAPGDKIHVIVFGEDTLTGDYVISSGGNLSFPLIGTIHATSMTVEQFQKALAASLADGYLRDPKVSIQVVSFRPFYILGEVNRPGEYPVSTGLTLQQAVAAAGGYTYRANSHRAYVKRADATDERLVDLRHGGPVIVHAGDTIRISERHF